MEIRHLKTTGTLSMPAPTTFNVGHRPKVCILNHEIVDSSRHDLPGLIPALLDGSLKEHARRHDEWFAPNQTNANRGFIQLS